ncbi:Ferrochelatase [Novosphingobium aromaticivorans DSM 12444]|uniref:Ferrochelatase n=1 Tax=Novosphingobium aromaticivorans (strain ATCC 700278 / DSM 12444 / CCUG 56034 / CIP 105152 / NBRC 16084 / F199) TaxID=279238 RepID=Q2G302_NOVAD|nr:ferrochelatase [Novosphingobium aromaticivorans]ABD27771.1 Ferrochelatase [Novosphingobium aromaticivorans DSM 12444]SCY27933.1 ferrochelatase [Novosphingobium aromaticivorans]
MQRPADHPTVLTGKVGVLLVNLGTPDAPDAGAVKRYLKEFLSDRRVVEIPALVWQPILRGIILNTRPRKSAHAYAQVWTDEGSPLAAITAAQARALQARLGESAIVRHAMRYQSPAMAKELDALLQAGCERILVAPLYPHYSGATTASALDAVADWIKARRRLPALRTLPPYHDDPAYIGALHADLSRQIDALDFAPELLLLSYHGMPERTLHLGDPYHCHCRKTSRLLGERFAQSNPALRLETTFQSRFGKAKWLEPATDAVLVDEARKGTRRIAIAAPGFSADCLETLEELAIRGKEDFVAAGGTHFASLACLNAGDDGMDMIEALVRRELSGWI